MSDRRCRWPIAHSIKDLINSNNLLRMGGWSDGRSVLDFPSIASDVSGRGFCKGKKIQSQAVELVFEHGERSFLIYGSQVRPRIICQLPIWESQTLLQPKRLPVKRVCVSVSVARFTAYSAIFSEEPHGRHSVELDTSWRSALIVFLRIVTSFRLLKN